MVAPKQVGLDKAFRNLTEPIRLALASERSPLILGLSALAIAYDKSGKEWMSTAEIVSCLEISGIAVTPKQIQKAFARAGRRLAARRTGGETKYRIMIQGRQLVQEILGEGKIQLVFIQGSQPREARRKLAEILGQLSGIVRISDPWYGERTLDALEMFPEGCEVRFLSAQTNEKDAKLTRAIVYFRKERRGAELRICSDPKELHDRYVLTDNQILIVGHGFKDIGNRESFMIAVDRSVAPDLIESVRFAFDSRWEKAKSL